MNNTENKFYVIGAGQMRTGTTSLKAALEILYSGKCYHMYELFKFNRNHFPLWISTFDRGTLNKANAEIILSDYCAAVDFPTSIFYKDLMQIYPNAKVVLTTRNSDEWVKSVKNTTLKKETRFKRFIMSIVYGLFSYKDFFPKLFFSAYKKPIESIIADDNLLKQCFEDFNEDVRKTVPPERLLEFNSKEGWEPLCKFLNLPVPNEPYPHLFTTEEFHQSNNRVIFYFLFKYGAFTSLFIAWVVLAIKKYVYHR